MPTISAFLTTTITVGKKERMKMMINRLQHPPHLLLLNISPHNSRRRRPTNALPQATNPTTPDAGLLFRAKLLHLQNLNINYEKALNQNPDFRSCPLSKLLCVEECLSSFGISQSSLGRILDMYPKLLTSDPYSDLYPIFDFLLNEVSLPFPDISKSISRCPRILISSIPDQLRPTLSFLQSIGFIGMNRITCRTSVLLVSSVKYTLIPKIEYLQSLGFEYEEVTKMVLRSPCLLTYSIEKNYKPKVEYFLQEMRGELAELKQFPQYFSFSLERRIIPRHKLLMEHGLRLPLPEMLEVSDGQFNAMVIEMRLHKLERR